MKNKIDALARGTAHLHIADIALDQMESPWQIFGPDFVQVRSRTRWKNYRAQ